MKLNKTLLKFILGSAALSAPISFYPVDSALATSEPALMSAENAEYRPCTKSHISNEDIYDVSSGVIFSSVNLEKEITDVDRHTFATVAYEANSPDQNEYVNSCKILGKQGWTLKKIDGETSGTKSTMGVMGFRGKQVIIATRGTEMTNVNDWGANLNSGLNAHADQFIGLKSGKVHNGFLQTHLSTWDQIKGNLIDHAKRQGVKTSDLEVETTGHSLGAAQQDLNQFHLNTDYDLQFGCKKVMDSFVDDDGFFGMPVFESFIGSSKVRGTAFAAPKVFDVEGAVQFNQKIDDKSSPHIQNRLDPVPHVPFNVMGYQDVGETKNVNSGHWNAHGLGNMKDVALEALKSKENTPLATVKSEQDDDRDDKGPKISIAKAADTIANKKLKELQNGTSVTKNIVGVQKKIANAAYSAWNKIKAW